MIFHIEILYLLTPDQTIYYFIRSPYLHLIVVGGLCVSMILQDMPNGTVLSSPRIQAVYGLWYSDGVINGPVRISSPYTA